MINFLSTVLAATTALSLFANRSAAESEMLPEARKSYVMAAERIPDFENNRKPQENWVSTPLPETWRDLSLAGIWKIKLVSDASRIDYSAMSGNSGPLDIKEMTSSHYRYDNWAEAPVPWPLHYLPAQFMAKLPAANDFKGYAYYQRMVEIPAYDAATQRIFLKFDGAGFRTDVWVNGKYAGQHVGVFSPFDLDITQLAKPGENVSLLVRCVHTRYGLSYRGALETGICDQVRLQVRGAVFPTRIRVAIDEPHKAIIVHHELSGADNLTPVEVEAIVEEATSGIVAGTAKQTVSSKNIRPLAVTIKNPHDWSPDDPFLYRLKIKINGQTQGITRFGYRTIKVDTEPDGTQRFFLNGKRFYMRAFEFNYWWSQIADLRAGQCQTACVNDQGRLREALTVMKFMNVNTLRPHSMDPFYTETFYNLCDELGLLVYFDWNGGSYDLGTGTSGKEDWTRTITSLEKTLPQFIETISYLHNHPSLAFISYTNELYDHVLPQGYSFDPIIQKYQKAQKSIDLQQRPTSGSTGRPTYRHDSIVDFVDDHQYIGVPYGSWQEVYAYLKTTRELINKKFAAQLPFVNMETGQIVDFRLHDQNIQIFTQELRKDIFDKSEFINKLTEKNGLRDFVRQSANAGGLRSYLTDMPQYRERKSLLTAKRYLEMFRYSHDMTDGVSLNTMPYDLMRRMYGRAADNKIEPWPENKNGLALAEPVYAIRTALYPVQALMRIDNAHLFGGAKTSAPIRIVNDSEKDSVIDLLIQLRDPQGHATPLLEKNNISLPQGAMQELPFEIAIPTQAASGKYAVEIYLTNNKERIAENHYDLYVIATQDRITHFPSRKVALYDASQNQFAGLGMASTGEILKSLKITHQPIRNFDDIANYQVLIIGANSFDATLLNSGKQINQWLNNGGRMLVFEQCVAGNLPWVSNERLQLLGKSSFVEHFYKKHPAFKGIEDEMAWETPAGQSGRLFETSIELNDGFLSLAAVADFSNPGAITSVINNRKLGKGEYFISTILATERFGKDATLTRYVENILNYVLSDDISVYATAAKDTNPPTGHVMTLNEREVAYIDLQSAANRSFTDEVEGDKQGGWSDYGPTTDLRNLPTGKTTLGGNVPFMIINPQQNKDKSCIVLAGPTRDYFPKQSAEIAVNKKLAKLFFLHTLMWVKAKEGDVVLEYEIQYADGGTKTIAMKNKIDIADWWAAHDAANGQVVYRDGEKSIFLTEWVNPEPNREIAAIRAISKGNAIPIIIAISGKQKFGQGIDRFEMDDGRK